jgi:hypothetical protein
MARGVVIRVVKVAFFGNGSPSSSSPHAEGPDKPGTNLDASEKEILINDRKTSRPIHRDFTFTSVLTKDVLDESVSFLAQICILMCHVMTFPPSRPERENGASISRL